MLESQIQNLLIKELEYRLPGCLILKNDPNYIQGIPDLLLLYNNFWIAFEVKRSSKSKLRPNQKYYINKMNKMSKAFIIYPENLEEVLYEVQQTLRVKR